LCEPSPAGIYLQIAGINSKLQDLEIVLRKATDLYSQLQQLSLAPFYPPCSIVDSHFLAQGDGFSCNRWAARTPKKLQLCLKQISIMVKVEHLACGALHQEEEGLSRDQPRQSALFQGNLSPVVDIVIIQIALACLLVHFPVLYISVGYRHIL